MLQKQNCFINVPGDIPALETALGSLLLQDMNQNKHN